MSSVYEPDKYHDGRSPSAWTISIGGMIASTIIAAGAIMGPNWIVIAIGVIIFVLSGIVSMVQSRRGLSNRVR